MSHGAAWALGSGASIQFWEDDWSSSIDVAVGSTPQGLRGRAIANVVTSTGHWNRHILGPLLDYDSTLKLAAVRPPLSSDGLDILYWKDEVSGFFSVSSAYHLLSSHSWRIHLEVYLAMAWPPTNPTIPFARCT